MILLIDRQAVGLFILRTSSAEYGDVRRYYCAVAPYRAILICRNGLGLSDLDGQTVDGVVGYEDAWREFARPGCEGTRHTKITIYRVAKGKTQQTTLGQILKGGVRDD